MKREGPLNMVARRDYSLTGPSPVSVFGDRMKLMIPGGLPRGMTRDE
ncbi:transcriptional regulator [Bifidobacterium myosotis]|uniref:Transcriptional regulator n=1 Tax=Bifidobacterium myosotis TaxID=1630166 RepID=A0A261FDA1_9BIFI|nr:transcriptional regulator [Bifidobacterium myosotis]